MEKGSSLHLKKVERNYTYRNSITCHREFYMESEQIGLKGIADLIAEYHDHIIVAEYKVSLPKNTPWDYAVQLMGIARLAEEHFKLPVSKMEFLTQGGKRRELKIPDNWREIVETVIHEINHLMEEGEIPEPSDNKYKCHPCEYLKVCGVYF